MQRRSATLAAAAGATVGILGLASLAIPASATDPELPAITPQKLLTSVMTAEQPALAGTVRVTNNLGIPAIPGMAGASELLSGGSGTFRVWADGQGRYRVSLPSTGSEVTVVDDGNAVWKWNSSQQTVTRYRPSEHKDAQDGPVEGERTRLTPSQAAKKLIERLRESSKVAVDGTATVAGRDAYELVLTPKPSERTVLREVRIAIGAQKRLPLRLVINTNGSNEPAFKIGFAKLELGQQDPELFQFTPPEGATVKRPEDHERDEGTERDHDYQVVGEGWDTVVVTQLDLAAMPEQDRGESQDEAAEEGNEMSLRGFAERVGKPVSGPWGHGWVVTTRAGSALLTADGRVAVGAVPTQILTEALAK